MSRVTGHYLERYATSSAHLKRLLMKRARRSCAHHGSDLEEAEALVDAEVARLVRIGALNDREYAASRARVMHRRGKGARAIRAALRAKGVSGEEVDGAVSALSELVDEPEWEAAKIWARKRRLGPWARTRSDDRVQRQKDLARLGRAGFSFDIARRILDLETP